MKNFKFSRLFAAVAFVAVLALSGCKQQVSDSKYIFGTWRNTYATGTSDYSITSTTLDNRGTTSNGTEYLSYAGDSLQIFESTDSEGIIFIKFTRAADSNWNYVTDASLAPDIGKWYAISYKELTERSVKISGAYKAGGKTSCDTLEKAKEEFTVANGYFADYSACAKL